MKPVEFVSINQPTIPEWEEVEIRVYPIICTETARSVVTEIQKQVPKDSEWKLWI